jgi:hypothetical protein
MGAMVRFRDPATRIYDLAEQDINVVCPRCRSRAVVVPEPVEGVLVISWPRRVVCRGCGYAAVRAAHRSSCWGGPVDPFFRLPLWLTTRCCGGRILWAFHGAHLDLIEGYVTAGLRERATPPGGMTLVARLPAWLKSARHRTEVVRAVGRLRASLTVTDRHAAVRALPAAVE